MASQTKAERQWWPLNEARPVAGSIRTGTGAVGDVELLCIPKYGGKQSNLFGNTVRVDLLSHGIQELMHQGVLALGRFKALGIRGCAY